MPKKTLRTTVSQLDTTAPLQGQPARDTAALILPITAIKLGENIRRDLGDLEELATSLAEHSVLQPLIVTKTARGFELVAGHRRLEAAKIAGLTEVPVRIVGADENQIAVLRLVENLIRENLSGADEVTAVAKLAVMFPDQVQLAKAIGKSKSYVSRCLKAAKLLDHVSCAGATRALSKSALFELADADQPEMAAKGLVSGTKLAAREAKNATSRKPSGPIQGGRYVTGAIHFRENEKTRAFSLRINYDPERTPPATKVELVRRLQDILRRLTISDES